MIDIFGMDELTYELFHVKHLMWSLEKSNAVYRNNRTNSNHFQLALI
ncbi:MAG: hypothetical protein V3V22_00195 [Methylococcales bacterium]